MKKVVGIIVALVAVCALVYFGFGLYLSLQTKDLVNTLWETEYGQTVPEKYEDMISIQDCWRLDWKQKAPGTSIKVTRPSLAFPYTQWQFNTAVTTFSYTVTNADTGQPLPNCDNVHCTVNWEFQDGNWVITSVVEG